MLSQFEQATAQFYEWEKRGRGIRVFDIAVDLEPPFVPFWYTASKNSKQVVVDDGVIPTPFSIFIDFISGKNRNNLPEMEEVEDIDTVKAFPYIDEPQFYGWRLSMPKTRKVRKDEVEQLLLMLSLSHYPISFEIIGTFESIRIQFVCREPDTYLLRNQLKAYFPDCVLTALDLAKDEFDIYAPNAALSGVDFCLKEEFTRPISTTAGYALDPLTSFYGIIEHLAEDERVVIQVLFKGTINAWSESIIQSVTDSEGGSFFIDAPEMLPLAKDKISSPLFAVTIKAFCQSSSVKKAQMIKVQIAQAILNISKSNANSLTIAPDDHYNVDDFQEDVMLRTSHRLGMILNLKELATFVHLPEPSVVSSKLEHDNRKTKSAPKITEGQNLKLGVNDHFGMVKEVTLGLEQRLRHTHIIGATGTGKSNFLLTLIAQDIQLGNGFAVLDPHGDLIENILPWITQDRLKDVIIIDPSDGDFPVGFNILTAHSEIEKDILSSDLVAVFRRLSTSWGDQMNSVFANAILAILESTEDGTLIDLRRFLIEKSFREKFLKTVTDPNIVYYWQKEFPLLKSSSIGPILTRLDSFLRPKLIRNIVAQKKSIDFKQIIDDKKIVLVKLSQGLIGSENSYLLGTFIVSKLQQSAMARQAQQKETRSPFFLYIDEFQNFITPSMSAILSGARKYHMGLVLVHQDLTQIIKQDVELASSVISNANTRICFRLGEMDAKKLAEGYTGFETRDFQNLGLGEAIVRVERPDYDFNLTTDVLPELEPEYIALATEIVIQASRAKYGTAREEVEASFIEVRHNESNIEFQEITKSSVKETIPEKPQQLLPPEPVVEKTLYDVTGFKEAKAESQHRYLQNLIKKMAESRGFIAKIEEPTLDGTGRVDVSLERNGKKIAVEVCSTTKQEWEIHNAIKCFNSGYTTVITCSENTHLFPYIQSLAKDKLGADQLSNFFQFTPHELFEFLDNVVINENTSEQRIKGYRVKVNYDIDKNNENL